MFSGEATSNDEHIVPRWMQRQFNLSNQTYHLPNGSKIKYKHAKIPVSDVHNTRFGVIENRLSQGLASLQEMYLWAFKIHIGLIYRSAGLRVDIRDPKSTTFWNPDDFSQEVWLFRQLYRVWAVEGDIHPNPFGTVFRAKALTSRSEFDFIHNMQSGVLFFQLGQEIIFVVLYDQGRVGRSNISAQIEGHRSRLATLPPQDRDEAAHVGQRVWACETAYFYYRARQGINFVSTDSSFHAIPPMIWRDSRPADEMELKLFCRSFGLKLEHFGGEVGNVFSNMTTEDIEAYKAE